MTAKRNLRLLEDSVVIPVSDHRLKRRRLGNSMFYCSLGSPMLCREPSLPFFFETHDPSHRDFPSYNDCQESFLPSEIWLTIFGFLDPVDLTIAAQVCTRWNFWIQSTKSDWLWEKIVHHRWSHLEKTQSSWRETFINLKRQQDFSSVIFPSEGWNRRPIYDSTRLKIYYWSMQGHIIEWDIAKRQVVTHKMPQELAPYLKYNAADVDVVTGALYFVSCHTFVKIDLKDLHHTEVVSIAGHNDVPSYPKTKILKWSTFADLNYLNGCCIDGTYRRAYFAAICKKSLYILSTNIDEFSTESSWCAVSVPFLQFPDDNQLANLSIVSDHTHDYICYLNVGETIFRVNCHPKRLRVLNEVTAVNTNLSWPTMRLSENGRTLYLVSCNACNVIDVSQPNEMTNVATKLKNVKLHPSYKQFQLKASPCPGIDTVRNFAYIGVCCMTLTNGGTVLQQQKMTIAKVDMKTGKVRKIIDLSDIRCNLLWIYCDPHAGQYGRLYLIGSRDGSIFLFKAIDLPKS